MFWSVFPGKLPGIFYPENLPGKSRSGRRSDLVAARDRGREEEEGKERGRRGGEAREGARSAWGGVREWERRGEGAERKENLLSSTLQKNR